MRDRLGGGGIVDEHVEPAPLVDAGLDQPLAVLVLRHVALHRDRVRARRPAGLRDLLATGLVGGVVDHDVAAARGEDLRAFRADAIIRARPRDDGGLSLQFQRTYPVFYNTWLYLRFICAALASSYSGRRAT